MPLVSVEDIKNGMVLGDNLFSPSGCFLLAQGSKVQSGHLQNFRGWGVLEVEIIQNSLGADYLRKQAEFAPYVERAEAFLKPCFRMNNLRREPEGTIYRHAVKLFAHNLQKGWSPPAIGSNDLKVSKIKYPAVNAEILLREEIDLPSFSTLYELLVEILDDPEVNSHTLAKIIGQDIGLSARLLQQMNRSGSGYFSRIDSIPRAVSMLGMEKLKSLIFETPVVTRFRGIPEKVFNVESFWHHSIRCALFARALATRLKLPGKEVCFVGGLLHDIGRLVLLEKVPRQYAQVIAMALEEKVSLHRAELDILKTDHGFIGKQLAIRWRLPAKIRWMIGGHHSLLSSFYEKEACLLHVADVLAHACGPEMIFLNGIPRLQHKAWDETGLKPAMLGPLIRQVDYEFNDLTRTLFQDSRKTLISGFDSRTLINA